MTTAACRPVPLIERPAGGPQYSNALGYLRAFVVALVVLHHAVLAYHPFAPPVNGSLVEQPRWWGAFPVVDTERWTGWALLVGFNDLFFMALMFFLSGLFVWSSLRRKGAAGFLRDRALRLGVPFALAASIVAPLAYYPAYLQRASQPSFAGFWQEWIALGNWPAGPAWFIGLLLVFDCLAAATFVAWPKWADAAGRAAACLGARPFRSFLALVSLSAAVYIPMAMRFHPFEWATVGPFTFQTSRILLYLMYFTVGIAIGAYGIERGLLATGGALSRRWLAWSMGCVLTFAVASAAAIATMTPDLSAARFAILRDASFTLACAASSFAFLAIFLRFGQRTNRMFDRLRDSSYGIYLTHYAFTSWLQYLLLGVSMPAIVKGILVFGGALALSWWVTTWCQCLLPARKVAA